MEILTAFYSRNGIDFPKIIQEVLNNETNAKTNKQNLNDPIYLDYNELELKKLSNKLYFHHNTYPFLIFSFMNSSQTFLTQLSG